MNKTAKIVLSIIGVSAIVVPAVLLIIFTSRSQSEPNIPEGSRQIDPNAVEKAIDKYPKTVFASPTPASPSAQPNLGSSPSAR